LEKNPILVTALNPLIGYAEGAKLVKAATGRGVTVRELAVDLAGKGKLFRIHDGRPLNPEEIEAALSDIRKLTEGGIVN
jgi:fumarate hydratase class II